MTALALAFPLFVSAQEELEAAVETAPLELNLSLFDWTMALLAITGIIIAVVSIYKFMELMIRMRKLELYESHGLEKFLE